MKTSALIDMLATGAGPAPRIALSRLLLPVVLGGVLFSGLVSALFMGLRPAELYATSIPWMKMGYAGLLALASGWLTARLCRPAARAGAPARAVVIVVLAMASWGAWALGQQPAAQRGSALMGHSWLSCRWAVMLLAMPTLAGSLYVLREMAPTRLRLAGFAAGLLSGAAGAFGYALACSESSPAFVAAWYTLGIGLAGLIGAWLAPRVLRW